MIEIPKTSWAALETAKETHQRLYGALLASRRLLEQLAAELDVATGEDRALLAKAMRTGGERPDTGRIEEYERRIAAERREAEGLELAVREAEDEIAAVVEQNRTRWQAEHERHVAKARATLERQLAQYAAARHALLEQLRLAVFLRDYPAAWRGKGVGSGWVFSLIAESGEPLPWTSVLAALEHDARGDERPSTVKVKALNA